MKSKKYNMKDVRKFALILKDLKLENVYQILIRFRNGNSLPNSLEEDNSNIFSELFVRPSLFKEVNISLFRDFTNYCRNEIKRFAKEEHDREETVEVRRDDRQSVVMKPGSTIEHMMSPLVERGINYDAASY